MARKLYFLPIAALVCAAACTSATAAGTSWRTWWGSASTSAGTYDLSSQVPVSPAETHSALLTSVPLATDAPFAVTETTLAQLRRGSAPNPWEVAWTLFRFRDLHDYYWFILKPNGWELGKKQGSDRQIFLATGSAPTLRIGRPYGVSIDAEGGHIVVQVDGAPVVDYVDPHPLPAGGSVGLYEEDAHVRFSGVSLPGT